jgi:TonB family protein
MPRLILVLGLALPFAALAQAPAGTLTRPPGLIKQVDAVYPPDAADAGVSGTVVMEVDLSAEGQVTQVKVVQSAGEAFDAAAVAAVKQFEFSPAEVDGQPAPVRIQYAYQFVMRAEVVAPEGDAGVQMPDGGVPVNFSGQLRIAGRREPLPGATVLLGEGETAREAVSGDDGAFEFSGLPPGKLNVVVSANGYEKFNATEEIKEGERTTVVYTLRASGDAMETVVRSERERREVAQVKLSQAEIRYVPGTQGEAFKVIQNLPGVSRTPFGTGALVVRGSKSWDSRTYVDDILIPQLFHFGGLTATFNSTVVEDISFQPGNFGAEFGRGIGGLIRAEVRTPSKTGFHGYLDANFMDVSAMVETPIGKDWSISVSGRRGLIDLTLPFALRTFAPQLSGALAFQVAPVSWDYQLRVERKGKEPGSRFFVALYGSSDSYAFVQPIPFLDPEAEGYSGAFGTSVLYNRLTFGIDQKLAEGVSLISRNSVGFDRSQQLGTAEDIYFVSSQVPIQLRERLLFEVPQAGLSISAGLDLLGIPTFIDAQTPPGFRADQIPDPYVERRLQADHSFTMYFEPAVFGEAVWSPAEWFTTIAGVRVDYESYMKKAWVDPRVSFLITPVRPKDLSFAPLTLKAGYGLYHQPPDYTKGLLSPIFGNPDLLPEGGHHLMVGAEGRFTDFLSLEVQGYYKYLFNQARQTFGQDIGGDVNVPGRESRYSSEGYGHAYGLEFLLRMKPWKGFFGWVAYTLSRFERDFPVVGLRPGPLDQPHNLIVVASYKLPFDIVAGIKLRWASGPLITPVLIALYDAQGNYYYPLPGEPWSERLPAFFQLDARLDKKFVFKDWSFSVYLDVQNVTNNRNIEGIFYNFDYTQRQNVYGIPILPSLGLRGEW